MTPDLARELADALAELAILRPEAAARERAVAAVQRVREELDRIEALAPADGLGRAYGDGARWAVDQARQALGRPGRPAATTTTTGEPA